MMSKKLAGEKKQIKNVFPLLLFNFIDFNSHFKKASNHPSSAYGPKDLKKLDSFYMPFNLF